MAVSIEDLEQVMEALKLQIGKEGYEFDFDWDDLREVSKIMSKKGGVDMDIAQLDSFDNEEDKTEWVEEEDYDEQLPKIVEGVKWLDEGNGKAILTVDANDVFLVVRTPYVPNIIPEMFEETDGCYVKIHLVRLWNQKTKTLKMGPMAVFNLPGMPVTQTSVVSVLNASNSPDVDSLMMTQKMTASDFDADDYDQWWDDDNDWDYTPQSAFAERVFAVNRNMEGPHSWRITLEVSSLHPLLNWVSRSKDLTSSVIEYATHMKV